MKIYRFFLIGIVAARLSASAASADANWHGDYHKAAAEVKASGKLLLISFDGSGWVTFSYKLRKEVYSQPEFIEYAKKSLVLLEVDFPRGRSDMPTVDQATAGVNMMLAQKLGINPYEGAKLPMVVVLTGESKEVARLPYLHGGAQVFIAALEKQLKNSGYLH
jgi:thioredoxin-related protein